MLRRFLVVAATLLAVGGPLAVQRAQAGDTVADLAAMTNADRRAAGLRGLATANDLQSLAQSRANDMAKSGQLAHTTNLGSKVSGWKRLGENVGRGPNLRDIETAFMASPSHRENILDPDFSQFGVGVTWDGKEYFYVAVVFRQPSGAATAPAPTPTTTPTTRAASAPPKPKPTTTTQPAPTTTTAPPTTTTTLAPPPPPPVEVAAAVEPPPVETTTTTAPRPIFTKPDFLAANFSDPLVPVAVTKPLPGRPLAPIFLAAVLGLLVGSACTVVALRQPGQLPEFSRLRHWR
ncbi:MAG TPA: CAP domain-containing protein [Acidimicrobiia bacterium]|nr:CAP domain-containing protein [Acidimicrobiia bacterium]